MPKKTSKRGQRIEIPPIQEEEIIKSREIIKNLESRRDERESRMVEEATAMMKPHVNAIKTIADKLMQRKTISGRLARRIFKENLLLNESQKGAGGMTT